MIDTSQFLRVSMNMHERLLRERHIKKRIALRRDLRHAPANQQDQIARFNTRAQFGAWPNRKLACIIGMIAAEQHCAA